MRYDNTNAESALAHTDIVANELGEENDCWIVSHFWVENRKKGTASRQNQMEACEYFLQMERRAIRKFNHLIWSDDAGTYTDEFSICVVCRIEVALSRQFPYLASLKVPRRQPNNVPPKSQVLGYTVPGRKPSTWKERFHPTEGKIQLRSRV